MTLYLTYHCFMHPPHHTHAVLPWGFTLEISSTSHVHPMLQAIFGYRYVFSFQRFLYSDGPSSLLVHKFLGDQLCLIVEDEGDSNDLSTASCVYYFCWCTGLYIAYSAAVMIHVALLNHRISKQWYDSEVTIILFTYHTIWIARCTGTSFVHYTVCTISIQGN